MITEHEYKALVAILNRAPVSQAEALWIEALLLRLRPKKLAQTPGDVQQPASDA